MRDWLPRLAVLALALAPACGQSAARAARDRERAEELCGACLAEFEAGRTHEARNLVNDALAVDPDSELAHRTRLVVAERTSDFAEVVASAEWLLEREPRDAAVLSTLAWSRLNQGDVSGARAALARLEEAEPGTARTETSWARFELEVGDLEAAKRRAQRSVAIDAGQAVAQYVLGLALEDEGDLEQAVLRYRNALSIDPGHQGARDRLATLLARLGRRKEADTQRQLHTAIARATPAAFRTFPAAQRVETFRALVELVPELPLARVELARALMQTDRLEEARESLAVGIALKPTTIAHELMAAILRRLGDEEGAREHARLSGLPLPPAEGGR